MIKKDLYFYEGEGGSIQTLIKIPYARYTQMYRLIADEGKELTDGTNRTTCIDVLPENVDKWTEVEAEDVQGV
jgi:hypothetical protein